MVQKAIIVGSAPVSLALASEDLGDYHKIAVNKSWRVRRDFDSHVYLQSLSEDDLPPLAAGITPIKVGEFSMALRNAGGLYLTSGSVAMIAGYWAIARRGVHFLSYYGCDLVFDGAAGGTTHYYGTGDTGPLVGNFQYNLRQRERSIRLLYWGLLHSVVVTNSSGLEGTLLAFPKVGLNVESDELLEDILSSQETLKFLRKASNVWALEQRLRTPAFRSRQKLFENDPEALAAMNAILDLWAELEPVVQDYVTRVEALVASAEQIKHSGRDVTPADHLKRQEAGFDFVLHLGAPNAASSRIQDRLDDLANSQDTLKVLTQTDLQRFFTKLNASFSNKDQKSAAAEQRNVQIVKNFSKRLFAELDIKDGDRVIIHEENALGSLAQCAFSGKTFPSPNRFLNNFAANLPCEPADVHVSIYNYADFFARAYGELLKSAQQERFVPLPVFVAKVMTTLASWTTTLEGMRLCFPTANIHVWCVDTPGSVVAAQLAALSGEDAAEFADEAQKIPPHQTPMVGEQVDAFMTVLARSGLETVLETQSKQQRRGGVGSQAFDPWSAPQRAHLTKLYEDDIAAIAVDRRFVFHGPAQPGTTGEMI